MDAFILVFTLGIMLAIGVPVAYAVGISAIIGAWYIDIPLEAVMIQLTSGVNKFSLLAIPFFILAGAIMAEGGMARRLVDFAGLFVGWIRGGLALVNILASTLFGAISGSSVADTASIGSVLIPEMERKGYPRTFGAVLTASASVQAILVPPSHNSVLFAIVANTAAVTIPAMFLAGIIPTFVLCGTLIVLCLFSARKNNYPKEAKIEFRRKVKIALDAIWGLITIVIISGGILSGFFTVSVFRPG